VSIPNIPPIFDAIAVFTPHGWVLRIWRESLSAAPAGDLLVSLLVLAVMGIAMFSAGAFLFRRRIA
jgi:hypothetical protein